jgi:glutamate 5-kinase
VVEDITRLTADTSTTGTQWGTGGMVTKLTAARIATAAGTTMVICSSLKPEVGARGVFFGGAA